jgi:hypothetical protein
MTIQHRRAGDIAIVEASGRYEVAVFRDPAAAPAWLTAGAA